MFALIAKKQDLKVKSSLFYTRNGDLSQLLDFNTPQIRILGGFREGWEFVPEVAVRVWRV